MSKIIIHSAKLKPVASKADIVVPVEVGENIHEKIEELAHTIQRQIECIAPGCFNELYILCENTPEGLMLGRAIDAENVNSIFLPLRYKIGNIHILCPDAASIYSQANNGMLMCRRLAQATYANVRASNSCNGKTDIVTWSQRGQIIMLERYDDHAQLNEFYDHPGHLLLHDFKKLCKKVNDTKQPVGLIRKFSWKKIIYSRFLQFILPHTFFSKHVPVHVKAK